MHTAFVTINKVPTKVTTWGKWVEESFDSEKEKDLIICIPGNPGFTQFYYRFLETLHQQLGWPIWIVSHAGHERPENENLYNIPNIKENKDLYNLSGQIKHKMEFFEKMVPGDVRLHLIGHSVGTYIITELMKNPSISSRVDIALEDIALTPNGRFYTSIVHHIVPIILFLTCIFQMLPIFLQHFLVGIYTWVVGAEDFQIPNICNLIHPRVLHKIFFMASDEMVTLKERNTDVIKQHIKKYKFYFGGNDNWAPVSYCKKLQDDIPDVDAEVCKMRFPHAFVLTSSIPAAVMVAQWMRQKN